MCGSFESGAGDNPDDLFKQTSNESTDKSEEEEELESSSAENGDASSRSLHHTEADEVEKDTEDTASDTSSTSVTLERTDDEEIAQQFIPDNYDKPYPWALGRDNALDGRPNKLTFFLQDKTLDLEELCLDEVNDILDGDVPQTDLREIALIVAYHQPELLAEVASAWGAESA